MDPMGENTMTVEKFEQDIRSYLHQKPFQPFVIELTEGDFIVVDDPQAMAFCEGAAGFIGADQVHMFSAEQVRDMRSVAQGAAS